MQRWQGFGPDRSPSHGPTASSLPDSAALYESDKEPDEAGRRRHREIRLKPDSTQPGYEPIVLRAAAENEVRVIAELVEVLPSGSA